MTKGNKANASSAPKSQLERLAVVITPFILSCTVRAHNPNYCASNFSNPKLLLVLQVKMRQSSLSNPVYSKSFPDV